MNRAERQREREELREGEKERDRWEREMNGEEEILCWDILSNENEWERLKGTGSGERERERELEDHLLTFRVSSIMECNSLSLSLLFIHLDNCSLHTTLICVIRFEAGFTSSSSTHLFYPPLSPSFLSSTSLFSLLPLFHFLYLPSLIPLSSVSS